MSLLKAIVVVFCLIVTHSLMGQTYEISTLDNFKPFSWKENGEAKGIDVDMTKELFKRAGLDYSISFVPWKRVMKNVEDGKSHFGFAAFKTDKREAFSHYLEKPLHYSIYSIFVTKGGKFSFNSVEDLTGKSFGINRGFNVGDEILNAKKSGKLKIEEANSTEQNLRKLDVGRMDGIIGNYQATLFEIKNMKMSDKITVLDKPVIESKGAYLIVSKKAKIADKKGLIEKLNKHLNAMYEDGTVQKINDKYLK